MIKQNNEPSQAESLVQQYYAQIYRYCYIRTSNPVVSQDLTQEIFCRFFQRLQVYQKSNKVRQILFTIAHNLCIDYYRKQAHVELLSDEEDDLEDVKDNDIEKRMTLLKILNQISYEHKEVLILYYYCEFKIKEIAEIIKISIPNVKYRLKAGKDKVKEIAEKEGMYYEEWFS